MKATVTFRGPKTQQQLHPGEIIGRVHLAGMHIDDARVSEGHAMVSLRDGELRLLSLRGALSFRGKPVREVALHPGLTIGLAPGVDIVVEGVELPDQVLGLEGPGLSRVMLPPVASIFVEPTPHVVARYVEDAPLKIWSVGEGWRFLDDRGASNILEVGQTLAIGPWQAHVVAIPIGKASHQNTHASRAFAAPLHLVAHYDTVVIHRQNEPVLQLQGIIARILTELVSVDTPMGWTALAQQLWPQDNDPNLLRHRLDANMSRLRSKLRSAGVRTDLVQLDGGGLVQFVAYPHDRVEIRS